VRIISTAEDYIVLLFLILFSGTGLLQEIIRLIFGISYSVGPWLANIFKLQPSAELMKGIPLLSKIHIIINLIFFAYFPFTKLVHAITFPIAYATRPYISVRRYVGLKR
jgi:nitrate reductase gamma subunit